MPLWDLDEENIRFRIEENIGLCLGEHTITRHDDAEGDGYTLVLDCDGKEYGDFRPNPNIVTGTSVDDQVQYWQQGASFMHEREVAYAVILELFDRIEPKPVLVGHEPYYKKSAFDTKGVPPIDLPLEE